MNDFVTRVWMFEEDSLIPAIEVDPNSVTPGVIGFVFTFIIAASVLLLVLDMVRRVRKVRYREEIKLKLDEEASRAADS
ncbi:MAG: hypothetical protein ACJAV4_000902 [Pontimonas sp.]